jgi:hypothetical protein
MIARGDRDREQQAHPGLARKRRPDDRHPDARPVTASTPPWRPGSCCSKQCGREQPTADGRQPTVRGVARSLACLGALTLNSQLSTYDFTPPRTPGPSPSAPASPWLRRG